jgi:hypothetical protein
MLRPGGERIVGSSETSALPTSGNFAHANECTNARSERLDQKIALMQAQNADAFEKKSADSCLPGQKVLTKDLAHMRRQCSQSAWLSDWFGVAALGTPKWWKTLHLRGLALMRSAVNLTPTRNAATNTDTNKIIAAALNKVLFPEF